MKRKGPGPSLVGMSAAVVAVVSLFAIAPIGAALTPDLASGITVTLTPKLVLKYRSVADFPGECGDFGLGLPCGYCEFGQNPFPAGGGYLTGQKNHSKTTFSVCTDLLTAVGAKQTWHAFYHCSTTAGICGVNLNETSGTLYAGQSVQLFFGLSPSCVPAFAGNVLSIEGPYNTLFIGYAGCG